MLITLWGARSTLINMENMLVVYQVIKTGVPEVSEKLVEPCLDLPEQERSMQQCGKGVLPLKAHVRISDPKGKLTVHHFQAQLQFL